MAEIEIGPLNERLSDEEIGDLRRRLDRLGAPKLPSAEDHAGGKGDQHVDSEALEELLDRLDEHEAACEIYLPVEFDGRAEVGGWRVGSAPLLLEVLDEVKDELDLEERDEEDEELDDDDDVIAHATRKSELVRAWKLLYAGAQAAIEQRLPLLLSV